MSCLPDPVAAPQSWGVQAEVGKDWPGSVNTSGFCSSDGQEVAVVYYREGYVPKNYDQQVSTDHSSCPCCGLASEFEMPCDPRGLCPVLSGVSPVQRGLIASGSCDSAVHVGVPGTHTIRKMSGFLLQ